MPFETKRIVQEDDMYLVQVKFSVERRRIISTNELEEAEKQMKEEIIREIIKELEAMKGAKKR